jgi:hypothetical protein
MLLTYPLVKEPCNMACREMNLPGRHPLMRSADRLTLPASLNRRRTMPAIGVQIQRSLTLTWDCRSLTADC